MNAPLKSVPEAELIQQLSNVRQALSDERQRLLDRVSVIDAALGSTPQSGVKKPKPTKATKGVSIKDGAILAVTNASLTMKEIQGVLSEHSPKSVESVVHGLVSTGTVGKDNSTPRRYTLAQPNTAIAERAR